MTDLGQFIGTLMASATHARRIADEESLAIAEYYRETPGLEGLSVPRIRMPEMSVEVPVLIESTEDGEDERAASNSKVRDGVLAELARYAGEARINVPGSFQQALGDELDRRLSLPVVGGAIRGRRVGIRGAVASEVDDALQVVIRRRDFAQLFDAGVSSNIRSRLRKVAAELAVDDSGRSPLVRTTVLSEAVKNAGSPGNVTRIRVVFKEEGLEWSSAVSLDGGERSRLTPE